MSKSEGVGSFFHHPRWSLPVIRRKAAVAMVDMVATYGPVLATGGRSLAWQCCYDSSTAYHSAVYRLRKQGVVAYVDTRNHVRVLRVLDRRQQRGDLYLPERVWNRKWNGIWNILFYDIVEKERAVRDELRKFLRKQRMGCLQRSVWISPQDVRPAYYDLTQALQIEVECYLVEAKTVLGRDPQELVRSAWNWERIGLAQQCYLDVVRDLQKQLSTTPDQSIEAIQILAREELDAYFIAMQEDPLLPKSLWPVSYKGKNVFSAHQRFVKTVKKVMQSI